MPKGCVLSSYWRSRNFESRLTVCGCDVYPCVEAHRVFKDCSLFVAHTRLFLIKSSAAARERYSPNHRPSHYHQIGMLTRANSTR